MFDIATVAALMAIVNRSTGTPYVTGGDTPAGTDCSGLASWMANAATGRPVYGDRFHTGNEAAALAARGFSFGTAPDALVIGWNGRHTAVTLPDGTSVSSGEGGGVKVGGGGAYQAQFTHHMFLPAGPSDQADASPDPADLPPLDAPGLGAPAPADVPAPADAPAPAEPPAPDAAPPVQPV